MNGYAQSKWVGERIVEKARQKGLKASIWRLGMIAPNSHSGEANDVDWITRFVAGYIKMNFFPILEDIK